MVGGAHPTNHYNLVASRSSLLQSGRAEKDSDLHLPSSCLHFRNRGRLRCEVSGITLTEIPPRSTICACVCRLVVFR